MVTPFLHYSLQIVALMLWWCRSITSTLTFFACHCSSSLCYLYHLTLAAICLNSTVMVPLCDCNTTVQLLSHFYSRLLYDCSTVPLQLLRQEYKCCAVHRLTTNVLNILKLSSHYKAAWQGLRWNDEKWQWYSNNGRICNFPFIALTAMASSFSVKGALQWNEHAGLPFKNTMQLETPGGNHCCLMAIVYVQN